MFGGYNYIDKRNFVRRNRPVAYRLSNLFKHYIKNERLIHEGRASLTNRLPLATQNYVQRVRRGLSTFRRNGLALFQHERQKLYGMAQEISLPAKIYKQAALNRFEYKTIPKTLNFRKRNFTVLKKIKPFVSRFRAKKVTPSMVRSILRFGFRSKTPERVLKSFETGFKLVASRRIKHFADFLKEGILSMKYINRHFGLVR